MSGWEGRQPRRKGPARLCARRRGFPACVTVCLRLSLAGCPLLPERLLWRPACQATLWRGRGETRGFLLRATYLSARCACRLYSPRLPDSLTCLCSSASVRQGPRCARGGEEHRYTEAVSQRSSNPRSHLPPLSKDVGHSSICESRHPAEPRLLLPTRSVSDKTP
jgi:hypothetical protein